MSNFELYITTGYLLWQIMEYLLWTASYDTWISSEGAGGGGVSHENFGQKAIKDNGGGGVEFNQSNQSPG